MKKFLTLLLTAITCLVCAFSAVGCSTGNGKPTLYVYTNAGFPPYEYMNEYGEVVGVDIDIMQEVGEILGYNVIINDIEFDQILVEVQNNVNAVGAAGMTQDPSRDEAALPSTIYAESVQYVIVPSNMFPDKDANSVVTIEELAQVTTKAIGVQEGTTGDFLISDAVYGYEDDDGEHVTGDLENAGLECMKYTNAIIASQNIGSEVGAVVIDMLPALSICNANPNLKCYELDNDPEYYVLYFNKNATELKAKVDKVLQVMFDSGVIDFLTLKHSGNIV